jgi:hypothetical protein
MATRKKGSWQHPRLRWTHRARRGMFLIGLTLVFVVAALFAMSA